MASKIDTSRVVRGFKRLEKDPVLAEIAVAAYQKPLRDGLVGRLNNANWPQNSREWAARKRKKGWGGKPWVRTGKTLRAISNNAPSKLGAKRGMKVGVNWRSARAFAVPRVFTDGRGARLPGERQELVFNTLKRGSAMAKLKKNASKRGRSLKDVLSEALGPKKNAMTIPARPLFAWSRDWEPEMVRDIDEAVKRVFKREGFTVR